jgi:hypothetical protein
MKEKKFGWNEYFKPTPKNFRRFGDSMLIISAAAVVIVPGAKWAVLIGLGGKLLSNFFSNK